MELVITGHHVELTDSLRDYAERKIGKLVRTLDGVTHTQVELSVNRNPSVPSSQIVEVTLFARGTVIRAEVASENMYASLDMVEDKLARQIRRYRDKMSGHDRHHRQKTAAMVAVEEPETAIPAEMEREIISTKRYPLQTLSPEDAAQQLELLGHNFFMFRNRLTEEINVVYHRPDGNFGLIEPIL